MHSYAPRALFSGPVRLAPTPFQASSLKSHGISSFRTLPSSSSLSGAARAAALASTHSLIPHVDALRHRHQPLHISSPHGRSTSIRTFAASSGAGGGKRITQKDYTEKAWEAIVAAPEIAREYSQQIVETEHLFKALMEQPNGLARRILTKAGLNPTRVLDKTEAFVRKQPRVTGNYEQVLGRSLESLITEAERMKKKWKDEFVSVEELVAAMAQDERFGRDLFSAEGLTADKLEAVIMEIRGGKT